jgi:hypothetical protein
MPRAPVFYEARKPARGDRATLADAPRPGLVQLNFTEFVADTAEPEPVLDPGQGDYTTERSRILGNPLCKVADKNSPRRPSA